MTARLRQLIRAISGQPDDSVAGPVVDPVADPESAVDPDEIEQTVALMDGVGDRWGLSARLGRFLRRPGRDAVTTPGEVVELTIPLERVARFRAAAVRYRIGDEVVAERSLDAPLPEILHHRPTEPGLFEVRAELIDEASRIVRPVVDAEPIFLQVIGDTPTVAVEVESLLSGETDISGLMKLVARGFALVYVDMAADDRTALVRASIRERGLPEGAVLVHPQTEAEVSTWGVDFRPVFLTATLRRLQGTGVPVVAIFSEAEMSIAAAKRAGIASIGHGDLEAASLSRLAAAAPPRPQRGDRSARLDRMTATEAVTGNTCHVELDNRVARERVFQAIEEARRSIHLQFYMVREGPFTDQLSARLVTAARRGVQIRLMVDALYSIDGVLGTSNAVVQGLRSEPGIEVVSSQPIASRESFDAVSLKRRDHRKIVVVDGLVAFVGGRNCADEYYTGFDEVAITDWTPHDRVPWLDAHLELRGPLVHQVQQAFIRSWQLHGGSPVPTDGRTLPPLEEQGSSRARLILHDGVHDAAAMLAYEAIIDGCTDRLYIVNDFPIVSSLQSALRRALARGARLVFLTGSAVARRGDGSFLKGPLYREAFEYMTKQRLGDLMLAGAEVYEYASAPQPLIVCRGGVVRPYVHAKVVSADGFVASVGSANLDATASYWEREANVVVEDPKVVATLDGAIEAMLKHSIRIAPDSEYWRREASLRELAAQFWPESLYG
jgi:phosphatidylserine/phosphatidylglycerophosphate/cardiolipin synthase-like enzyme